MEIAALAGFMGAISALFGKIGLDPNSDAMSVVLWLCVDEKSEIDQNQSDYMCGWIFPVLVRGLLCTICLGANTAMLGLFLKSLRSTSSIAAVVISTGTNIVSSGILATCIGENITSRFYLGFFFICGGITLIAMSDSDSYKNSSSEIDNERKGKQLNSHSVVNSVVSLWQLVRRDYFAEVRYYRSHHKNMTNWIIHAFCVPLEWLSFLILVAYIYPLMLYPIQGFLIIYYISLATPSSICAACGQMALTYNALIICEFTTWHGYTYYVVLLIEVVAWGLQILVGHLYFEKNSPGMYLLILHG